MGTQTHVLGPEGHLRCPQGFPSLGAVGQGLVGLRENPQLLSFLGGVRPLSLPPWVMLLPQPAWWVHSSLPASVLVGPLPGVALGLFPAYPDPPHPSGLCSVPSLPRCPPHPGIPSCQPH